MKSRKKPSLLKLPEDNLALNLIREELKIRKLFNILRELGMEE